MGTLRCLLLCTPSSSKLEKLGLQTFPLKFHVLYIGIPVHTADLLSAGVGAGGMCRIFIAAASDRYGRERCFAAVLIAMTFANAILPVLINSVAGAMCYAVVIGACTGCLVALVLPLASAALADSPSGANSKAQPRASAKAAMLRAARQSSRGASNAGTLAKYTSAATFARFFPVYFFFYLFLVIAPPNCGKVSSFIFEFKISIAYRNAALAAAAAADWPPSSSITSGLVYTMLAVGHEIGPVVCGALYDLTGSYTWGFWFTSIFCGAAAVVATALIPQSDTCLDNCGNGSCCGYLYTKVFGDSQSIWHLGDEDVVQRTIWTETLELPHDSPEPAQSPFAGGTDI